MVRAPAKMQSSVLTLPSSVHIHEGTTCLFPGVLFVFLLMLLLLLKREREGERGACCAGRHMRMP